MVPVELRGNCKAGPRPQARVTCLSALLPNLPLICKPSGRPIFHHHPHHPSRSFFPCKFSHVLTTLSIFFLFSHHLGSFVLFSLSFFLLLYDKTRRLLPDPLTHVGPSCVSFLVRTRAALAAALAPASPQHQTPSTMPRCVAIQAPLSWPSLAHCSYPEPLCNCCRVSARGVTSELGACAARLVIFASALLPRMDANTFSLPPQSLAASLFFRLKPTLHSQWVSTIALLP